MCLGYFERLRRFDDEISMDFSHNFHIIRDQEYMTTIRGLTIRINEASINNVSNLPLGIPWDKEERQEAINAKKTFFLHNEKPDEDKNGIKRESLPHPW
jgi:hypothetical protein